MKKNKKIWSVWAAGVIAAAAIGTGIYGLQQIKHPQTNPGNMTQELSLQPSTQQAPKVLGMRKFPYPYQAMLAISSDADHETLRKFNLIHEFINTHDMTPFGYYGIGIPFADSFFMYNGSNTDKVIDYGDVRKPHELSWFKGTSNQPYAASILNYYIHVGWIDTLHSWGDFTMKDPFETRFSPELAAQAIQALKANGDYLTVWTDHGNQSNVDDMGDFGLTRFYRYQQGANPWSPYYHADMTIPYGVRFIWADGANDHFGMSSMIYPMRLPNGDKVWGFWRYTSNGWNRYGQPEWNWTVGDLSEQITRQKLEWLEQHHDYSIIAQHLEALNTKLPLPPNAIDALWLLAGQYDQKKLLIATTSQLLNYNVVQQYVRYHVTYGDGKAYIHIDGVVDPVDGSYMPTLADIRGLTFYTTNPNNTVIELGNLPVPDSLIVRNPSDGHAPSIGIRWFTWSTKNYAIHSKSVY